MTREPANAFRLTLPADGSRGPQQADGPLLREAFETTELENYARRLWSTSSDRIRFLLELPASRRWLEVSLTATEPSAGVPATLVEGALVVLPHRLTTRELEVLTLVAAGHSNPAIAQALFTSPRTVSTQLETIRGKLGAISRTAAGVLAVQHGWLRMPMSVSPEALGGLDIAGLLRDPQVSADAEPRSAVPSRRRSAVRLGLAYPAVGPARHDGEQSRRGALLAIDEINRRGGVRGRPIEPVIVDGEIYTAEGIRRSFAELRRSEVQGVLMSYVFDEASALDEASRIGVPVLHTMTSERHLEALSRDPDRHSAVFQCVPPETNYGSGLVRFVDALDRSPGGGALDRTVRFVETTADSGRIADATTLAELGSRGWSITGIDPLVNDPGALDRLAASILAEPPAVLVISEFLPSVLASLLLRLRAEACPSILYTIYAPSVPQFMDEMGEAAEGLVWATVSGTYRDTVGAEFRAAYEHFHGVAPGYSQAGLAYDMTRILASAWQWVADPSDVPATVTALRDTRYRGVNGSYTFASGLQSAVAYPEETADPSLGNAHVIFQVQDGEQRCLGPAPYADAGFRVPALAMRSLDALADPVSRYPQR